MRIFFLGNCQINALCAISRDLGTPSVQFGSITEHWGVYDEGANDAALAKADMIIAQAVPNGDHRYSAANLRQSLGDRLVLLPYVYLDGMASLEVVSSKGRATIKGADILKTHPAWPNPAKLHTAYSHGEIDMRQRERLGESLARIRKVERDFCDIPIADFIEDNYSSTPPLYAINHPTQPIIFEMFSRLAKHIGWGVNIDRFNDPLIRARRALPRALRAFSRHDVQALALNYPEDTHWFSDAGKLIRMAVQKSQV